jgi:hypothetical protein
MLTYSIENKSLSSDPIFGYNCISFTYNGKPLKCKLSIEAIKDIYDYHDMNLKDALLGFLNDTIYYELHNAREHRNDIPSILTNEDIVVFNEMMEEIKELI